MKRNRTGYRRVPLNKEMIAILDEQRERFKAKFGREPRGEDPILFDENADTPQPMALDEIEREVLEFLAAVNLDPALNDQPSGLALTGDQIRLHHQIGKLDIALFTPIKPAHIRRV